jgi:hypothetical protein
VGERPYIKGPPVVGQGKSVTPEYNLVIGFCTTWVLPGTDADQNQQKNETILDRAAIILYLN